MFSLRADNLGKSYRIYKRPMDSLKELFFGGDYADTFWALRDVSFEIVRGGSLGIVGDNGAGKSTLLKLLAGATTPSVGRVERVGRTAAILTLGAGFHPDLSGRENIRIGCAVLGLSPAETEEATPEIIDFSELGAFIDRAVSTYSSGMYLRLAFAVATTVRPDLLVIDEHLSVGDQHFQLKCVRRLRSLRDDGCSLVFCSHDLHQVREMCDRTLWIRAGHPAMLAATPQVITAYQDHVRALDGKSTEVRLGPGPSPARSRAPDTHFLEAVLEGDFHDGVVRTGSSLELRVVARLSEKARRDGVHLGVLILRNDAVWCYATSTLWDAVSQAFYPLDSDRFGVRFVIDDLPLLSGEYSFTLGLMDATSPLLYDTWTGASPFTVRHDGKDVGMVRLPHRWLAP